MPSTSSPPAVLLGDQTPRILHAPPRAGSAGPEAVELAALAGLVLDPWQELALEVMLGENDAGKWAALECGIVVPRQNGKGSILEARELAGLFLLGEQVIVHTAHLFDTCQEAFRRILELIEQTPELDRRVRKVSRSHGAEGIELKTGQRLLFKARTGKSGRGFSGDCVVLDEAFDLSTAAHGALFPTLSARPNPQIVYASSAVNQRIHPNGVVLSALRSRALAGDDPSLCWIEHSADEETYWQDPALHATDRRMWAMANPGLGIRIDADYVAAEHRAMDPETFRVERLGIGDWPDPDSAAGTVISLEDWGALADESSRIVGSRAFAVDVNPERSYTSIAVAGSRADGHAHVEIVEHLAGTSWAAERIAALVRKWDPVAIGIDANGPAASLVPYLEALDLHVRSSEHPRGHIVLLNGVQLAQACASFYDEVADSTLRHLGQSQLDAALRAAKKRERGDAWTWSRKSGADISPLVAVTIARQAFAVFPRAADPDLANAVH